jgi:hypothetical protein
MDENRKKELYSQLKDILAELKNDGVIVQPVVEQLDDGILRINIIDAFGANERVG